MTRRWRGVWRLGARRRQSCRRAATRICTSSTSNRRAKARTSTFSSDAADTPSAANRTNPELLLPGRAERSLDRIVHVCRDRVIAPEPAHHLGKHRTSHALAVRVHAPRVVHVVALGGERLHQPDVLKEPVATLIVRAA